MTSVSRGHAALGLIVSLAACTDAATTAPQRPQFQSFEHSEWSEPVHLDAPINSPARELGATLSPDGLSLYFGSDRTPGGFGGFDIWVARRACPECPWGAPVNLGPNINAAGGDGGPVLSHDGLLLFYSGVRTGGLGGEDVWVSHRTDPNDDLGWGPAVNLGPNVNSTLDEHCCSYVPALNAGGAALYFARGGSIFEAGVTRDGEAPDPAVPVEELNYPGATTDQPSVRADGREVFFWSDRPGLGGADIWVATRRSPHEPWSPPENLGPPINTRFADRTPRLSWDGRTLLFSAAAAARPSLGLQDIWMSTRTPSGR